ncbi:NAD(P)/FAD-dependent oxidoreductase [Candidatus Woesearchaeota archaeon]|nr:NAD(P)/FAD-dependent oxidoreductase [Candidatus Woesearchaeota archaeon]
MIYDLVILGGGSAGYSAAMTALKFKKKVCIIEKGPFGGLCILKGCMPSKTLIYSARINEIIKKSKTFGIDIKGKINIDPASIINRKNKIIQGFADYRKNIIKNKRDINLIYGEAKFISKNEVEVNKRVIKGKNFLISTGSKESIPPILGLKETGYIISDEALELKKFPKSLAILGGGPVAIELGYYFNGLGVKTAIIQRSEQILSNNDLDCAKELENALKNKGISIYTNTSIKSFSKSNKGKKIIFDHNKQEKEIIADEILVAFGRKPNLEGLNVEKAGIKPEKGLIKNSNYLETNTKNIYIAGDSSANLAVVNVAVEEGRVAATNMFSKNKEKIDYSAFPMAVFSHPEFAWIGLSEKEAEEKKINVKIGKFYFKDLGKAECIDETEGFIKFIADKKTNKILGVSIVGHEASDLIHEAIPLLYFKATLDDLKKMPHLHPTFGEIYSYLVDEMI